MEESKTLVEQLREMVELSIESNRYPTMYVDGFIGREVETTGDERELFTVIADRIEREYMPMPMLEGEPLKVGDRVDGYFQEGAEVVAVMNSDMVVVRSTVKGGKGYHDEAYPLLLWSVDELKRPEQEVLDADGVPIHVGDHIWYKQGMHYDGIEYVVTEVTKTQVRYKNSEDEYPRGWCRNEHASSNITHKQPDTLDSIEEDAFMDSITYCNKYGLIDSRCNAEEGDEAVRHCVDCGLSCETRMVKHLLRRQRELLERGQE